MSPFFTEIKSLKSSFCFCGSENKHTTPIKLQLKPICCGTFERKKRSVKTTPQHCFCSYKQKMENDAGAHGAYTKSDF